MAARAVHRRASGRLAAAIVCALVGAPSPVLAAPKFQAVGDLSLGYTDNIQSAPDHPLPGQLPKEPGAFSLISPGVVMAYANPATVQRLSYTYLYSLFFSRNSASSSSNQLDYHGFFDLSPRTSLVVGTTAVQSNTYSSVLFAPPAAGAVNALPPGGGSFLAANGNEIVSSDIARDWRTWENASFTMQTPIFGTIAPETLLASGRLGIERAFFWDAAGLEGRVDYTVIRNSILADGTHVPILEQLVAGGVATWRHDWGRYFTSSVEAGPLRLQRLRTDTGFWFPHILAMLAYATEVGDAQLTYGHTMTTNPILGQALLVDEVRARGALPLTKKGELLLAGSLGYQNGRLLDANSNLAANVDSVLADAAFGWQLRPELLVGVRYQHIQQISDVRTPPLPVSFVRNAILVGATVKLPSESAMPHTYRAPLRVDRTDEIRDAVEPATPGMQQINSGAPGR
jgi:hypothetical protein